MEVEVMADCSLSQSVQYHVLPAHSSSLNREQFSEQYSGQSCEQKSGQSCERNSGQSREQNSEQSRERLCAVMNNGTSYWKNGN